MSVKRCGERCQIVASIVRDSVSGTPKIKAGAFIIIEQMNSACQQCCQGKGFYKNCIKPLQNVCSEAIKPHNDVAFNDHYDDHINNKDHKTGRWHAEPNKSGRLGTFHVNPPVVKPEPIKPLNNKIERKPNNNVNKPQNVQGNPNNNNYSLPGSCCTDPWGRKPYYGDYGKPSNGFSS